MTLACVVLAAGASRRLGTPKQLVLHEGVPLVRRAIAACAGLGQVGVVLGARRDEIALAVEGVASEVLTNDHSTEGIASSIRVATRWAQSIHADALLLHLVDQPLVGTDHLRALANAWREGAALVGTRFRDVVGAPAVFDRRFFDALLALEGDRGAGSLLRSHPEARSVTFEGAALDVDTPADLQRWSASSPKAIRR